MKDFWSIFGKAAMFATAFTSAAILTVVILKDKEPVKSELLTDLEYIEVQMDAMDGKLDLIDSLLQAKSSTAGVTTKTE